MPQLPSGLHFALDPSPIQAMIDEVYDKYQCHTLMAIETTEQLFSYIKILYFRPRQEQSEQIEYATYSTVAPEDLEPYDSGYNLISIQEEFDKWDNKDQKAFIDFLNAYRTDKFLQGLLEVVIEEQNHLLENPRTLHGLFATWWKLGCHPLQDEDL